LICVLARAVDPRGAGEWSTRVSGGHSSESGLVREALAGFGSAE
jgi:hypothetical protein